jgi:PAS domain S-box-containing protein
MANWRTHTLLTSSRWAIVNRYGLAIGLAGFALGFAVIAHVRTSQLRGSTEVLVLLATAMTVWYAGTRPGLVALLVSCLGAAVLARNHLVAPGFPLAECLMFLVILSLWEIRVTERASELERANLDLQRSRAELLSISGDLQESKARLEEAQRVAHVGHWEWNLDTGCNVWSAETYRIYGLTPREGPVDIAAIRDMIHSDDRESVFRIAEEAVAGGTRPDAEHRIVRPSGEVRTVHSQGDVKRDASGRPYLMFGTVQDVTERRRADEALRQTQVLLSEGQRLAHMGSWASNGGEERYWSDGLFKLLDFDARDGPPSLEQRLARVHPADRASMADAIRVMHAQRRGCDMTTRFIRPDGELRYIRSVGIPVIEQDSFKGFLGTAIDVTEHELLTQELRRQQAYLTEAQRLTHTGSWACNLVTRQIFHSSDENARLYGFDPSQGGMPFERFYGAIHEEDEPALRAKLESAIRSGEDYDVEFRICRPDGTIRFLRGVGQHSRSGEPGDYVGITMDITERKHAEEGRERLRQLEADLAHINRVNMMGELAAALAHEITQPIAASITSANACIRWLAHDPPALDRARAAATRVEQDGHRAIDVVQRLRSFYKKGVPPARALVEVKKVIGEMIDLLRIESARHSISIKAELDAHVPAVLADRVQLQQVLLNLMLNAIDAMRDTGGVLTITVRPNAEGQVLVSVSDTGAGLPAENTERLFDAFHTTKPQGTGMGLTITRSIVQAHGGQVWATRNTNAGASFHFTLPSGAETHA